MSMKNPPPLPWLVAETEDLACEAIIYALEELKEKVRRGKKELKVRRRQKKMPSFAPVCPDLQALCSPSDSQLCCCRAGQLRSEVVLDTHTMTSNLSL